MIFWVIWLIVTLGSFAVMETMGVLKLGIPTLSHVWKFWEDGGAQVKGVVKWTLFRCFTLLMLISLSTYLVIHWVAEAI